MLLWKSTGQGWSTCKKKLKIVLKKCWQCRTCMILYQSCVKQETQNEATQKQGQLAEKHCSLSAVAQQSFAQNILWKRAFKNDCTKTCLACTLTSKQQCNPEKFQKRVVRLKGNFRRTKTKNPEIRKNRKETEAKFNLG